MTDRATPTNLTLGFLTVLTEAGGYLGGYLVTNAWGRPLEFRLTTSVQPNRVQEILYGATLSEYILADLIGKTLIEKTATQPSLIVADTAALLPLRARIDVPVIALPNDKKTHADALSLKHSRAKQPILYPVKFSDDGPRIQQLLDAVDQAVELSEPFTRVREAITEARKMGVTSRAA
ncbi:hypothetical protein [Limnoglobus roseus]|uniref:Uncharacterized protein n=1 Tax=Limnoglobus roseus TaxID=2598579 RepID=A0A5C1ALP5_9BACT|nr:hypothetical protein [Limnoglobus roseus]QEL18094.1 hypothetical protein PX52LOC_05108 [Limnoglobus roseus]